MSSPDPFESIESWAGRMGLTNGTGAAALKLPPRAHIEPPRPAGVREMVEELLQRRGWNPRGCFSPAEVALLVRETGQEEARVRAALRELRQAARKDARTPQEPAAPPALAGSDPSRNARALALELAGELLLLADGKDRELLLKAAELTLKALGE